MISPPSPYRDTPDPNGLPLGLCMLASMVRDSAEVQIVDAYTPALSVDKTVRITLEAEPDIVGISLPFSFSEKPGLTIAEGIKSVSQDVPIIFGGIQSTLNADSLLRNEAVDAVAMGEAEYTLVETIERLSVDCWNSIFKNPPMGLTVSGWDGKRIGSQRPYIEDPDSLPLPSFDLLPGFPENYSARILTSRGCKFKCPYCASAAYWGHVFRPHSPERVLEEMRALKDRWGISRISYSDDTFNMDPVRSRVVANLIIDTNIGMEWGASCRPELLTEDDLKLFSKAGMTGLFLGLESGSPKVLQSIHRAHDLEKTRDLIQLAEDLGIEVHASFMIGLPDEREDDIDLTLEYARALPSSSLGFHIFHPLPGSEYGENPEKFGITIILPDPENPGIGAIDGVAPVKTKNLSPIRILDYYHIARGIAEKRMERKTTG